MTASTHALRAGRAGWKRDDVKFDPSASHADNTKAILEHLRTLDAELGPLLARHLDLEALAAMTDQERRALRGQIAAEARTYLDNPQSTNGPSS
jgi:hypothetical protein